MDMQGAINHLTFPKSLIRRTSPIDLVETFRASTATRTAKDVRLDVYESTGKGKWFVILTPMFAGWTINVDAAFFILRNAFVYTFDEMREMADKTKAGRR